MSKSAKNPYLNSLRMKFWVANWQGMSSAKNRTSWHIALSGSIDSRLQQIIKNNAKGSFDYGMAGGAQMLASLMSPEHCKATAAGILLHLRRNKIALKKLGVDPNAATDTLLARAASLRRMAMTYAGASNV